MCDLENVVRSSIEQVRGIKKLLEGIILSSNIVINIDNYNTWIEKTDLIGQLENTLPLFPIRDAACKELCEMSFRIKSGEFNPATSTVSYGGIEISVSAARILAMTTHLASYWSLYDCLTNIIGRVLGCESIRKNPMGRRNPKLMEAFLLDEKSGIDPLGLRDILLKSYCNYIGFSYLLRNCYVHEGGMVNCQSILSTGIVDDAFFVDDDVAEKLNKEITARYKIPNVTIVKEGNLIKQLQDCNAKLDDMFISLLRFMTGTLAVEIEAFATNDGFKLS